MRRLTSLTDRFVITFTGIEGIESCGDPPPFIGQLNPMHLQDKSRHHLDSKWAIHKIQRKNDLAARFALFLLCPITVSPALPIRRRHFQSD